MNIKLIYKDIYLRTLKKKVPFKMNLIYEMLNSIVGSTVLYTNLGEMHLKPKGKQVFSAR